MDIPRCFLAGTPILLPDGSEALIETIRPGDAVAAFAGGGDFDGARGLNAALEPRPVARLFSNVTTEIIAITYGEADVIPGPRSGARNPSCGPSGADSACDYSTKMGSGLSPAVKSGMTGRGEKPGGGRSRVSLSLARDDAAHSGTPAQSGDRTIYLTSGHTMLTASGRTMTARAALMAGEAFVSAEGRAVVARYELIRFGSARGDALSASSPAFAPVTDLVTHDEGGLALAPRALCAIPLINTRSSLHR